MQRGSGRSDLLDDRVFYEDDDDERDNAYGGGAAAPAPAVEEEEEDPLDAFMRQNEQVVVSEASRPRPQQTHSSSSSSINDDYDDDDRIHDDDDDDDDDYKTPAMSNAGGVLEYDSDGYPVKKKKAKVRVEPLQRVDHTSILYAPFRKSIYKEHLYISSLSAEAVATMRKELECHISVDAGSSSSDSSIPRPISEFVHTGFEPSLLREITAHGYAVPTPIQAQGIPISLSGRDLIALARTGSGKTMAFLWPAIAHILEQPQLQIGDGPIALVLVPTHELCLQILQEAKKFLHVYRIRAVAVHGGAGRYEMTRAIKETAPELIIATPGRLIDMLRSKTTNLLRATFVVLDEADRMFDMGFEYQIRSILHNTRPDRQTLLFSATMNRSIESFAREVLTDPVRLAIGSVGAANPDVKQIIVAVPSLASKLSWLLNSADAFVAEGKVLVFVLTRSSCDDLCAKLSSHFANRRLAITVGSLHGNKTQEERRAVIKGLRSGATSVVVATDIASRGLDIEDINTIVNFESPKNIDTYIHRIGRTARMSARTGVNREGSSYALLSSDASSDGLFSLLLYKSFVLARKEVPPELRAVAEAQPAFRSKLASQRGGSGGGSGYGKSSGLGTGAYDNVAYTSEMAAAGTGGRAAGNNSNSTSSLSVSSCGGGGATVMGGMFVRAAQPTAISNASSSDAVPARKRSRWDA